MAHYCRRLWIKVSVTGKRDMGLLCCADVLPFDPLVYTMDRMRYSCLVWSQWRGSRHQWQLSFCSRKRVGISLLTRQQSSLLFPNRYSRSQFLDEENGVVSASCPQRIPATFTPERRPLCLTSRFPYPPHCCRITGRMVHDGVG